jgi:hypothetical protein
LGAIQGKTSLILQEQERDLLRSFKMRLADVVAELERERKKNESGSVEWVQRCRSLTEQLVWQQELTGSLSSENKHLLADNRRMARAHQTMEADRAFLIKQLVGVKKENARLRFLVEQQIKENQELTQHIQQQQQQQYLLEQQQQQQQQQQLLMPPPTASSGTSGASPSPLTQRSLAAHNNNGNGNGNGSGGAVVVVPALKLPAQFHSGALIPANMRQSLLAAATTEGSLPAAVYSSSTPLGATSASQAMMHMMQQASSPATGSQTQRPATSGGMGEHYLPPTGHVGPGGRATSGAQSARLASTMPSHPAHQPQAHPNLPEARLSVGQEARFKSVIASLKRRLDSATHEARAAKTAFVHAVQAQTQLQHLFKQCVESVRETSATRRAAAGGKAGPLSPRPPAGLDPRSPHWPELSSAERASVLEWLLSQHSVMTLLFDKMFPAGPTAGSPSSMAIGGGSGLPQLYSSSEQHHSPQQQQQHAVGMHFDYAQFMVPPKGGPQSQQQQHELVPSPLAQRNAAASAAAQQQGSTDDADEEYEQILLPSGTHAAQAAKTGATKSNKKAAPTSQVNRAAYALSPRAFDDAAAAAAGNANAAPVAVDYFAPDDEAEQRAAAAAAVAHTHSPLPPPPTVAGVAKPARSAMQVQHLMQSRAPKPQQHEAKE